MVKRFDGEYPDKYLGEVLEYLEINVKDFNNLCDKFRPPHLWEKTGNDWKLKKPIYSL